MYKKIFIILILFFAIKAEAASVVFNSESSVKVNSILTVTVIVQTGGEQVNSFDFDIDYPENLFDFYGYKEKDSLIKMFIDVPYAKNGQVYFSGIIPGGVAGLYDPKETGTKPIPIITLLFKAKSPGDGTLSFNKSLILKNDGLGTALVHDVSTTTVKVIEAVDTKNNSALDDTEPPLPFNINLVNPNYFLRTPMMLVFNAVDNQSGVKSYQIKSGNSGWKYIQSPKSILPSIFRRQYTIRATDYAGNSTDATITIPGSFSWALVGVLLAAVLFVLVLIKYLNARRK